MDVNSSYGSSSKWERIVKLAKKLFEGYDIREEEDEPEDGNYLRR